MKREQLKMDSVQDLTLSNTIAVLGKIGAGTAVFASAVVIGGLKTAAFKALEAPEGSITGKLLDTEYQDLYTNGEKYGAEKVVKTLESFGVDVRPVKEKAAAL